MVSTPSGFLLRASPAGSVRTSLLLAMVPARNADAQHGGLLKQKVNRDSTLRC